MATSTHTDLFALPPEFVDLRDMIRQIATEKIAPRAHDIDASAEDVFRLINDVEKVATCVPGAAITGKDGETYLGGVKVKVGPISASYAGTIRFLEVDAETRTLLPPHASPGERPAAETTAGPDGGLSEPAHEPSTGLCGRMACMASRVCALSMRRSSRP